MTTTSTTCPYCGVGCGVLASRTAEGAVTIAGDTAHPANFGRLCSKGSALAETVGLEERLLFPELGGKRISWDEALSTIAAQFMDAVQVYGADSVAFYVSGQLLTEDYYVANKLMKGFIGSGNIDTNSRLCMSSAVAGHKRAFGTDTVPCCYDDLEEADLVVLVGSNLAWCHPVLFQRISAAKEKRPTMRVVNIDPRRTATSELVDLHLGIAPGSDVALFNGLLHYLAVNGAADVAWIEHHTNGMEEALQVAAAMSLTETAAACGLTLEELERFYRLFAATEKTVTAFSQGVNQWSFGTDKVNAIINCHLLTRRIGRPGMGPFSITGQPNAMGGREVGGLANQLASHLDIATTAHRAMLAEFWQTQHLASSPGLMALDLFRAAAEGKIKALWIIGTNPVVSLVDAEMVKEALQRCPFVVVSDLTRHTDTAACADMLLPAAGWGEKDGTVTNSERRISRQRAFLPLPGEAKADWRIISEVARRMGFGEAFAYQSPADIFREHAALSGKAAALAGHDFDLGVYAAITDEEYDSLTPFQWGGKRFFADGIFYTPDQRARFVPTPVHLPATFLSTEYPLILNTGRVRDHWHTMTRTGKAARLSSHVSEPFVELHPDDASAHGIAPHTLVVVESERGRCLARASITERQQKGSVFIPIHWNDQFASEARVDTLMAPFADPVSGQPESKWTPVCVSAFKAAWWGFVVMRKTPPHTAFPYWALARSEGGWRMELADDAPLADADLLATSLLQPHQCTQPEWLTYSDPATKRHRFALLEKGQLLGCVFIEPKPITLAREWLAGLLEEKTLDDTLRLQLLAGRAGVGAVDTGAIICSCFKVGVKAIERVIASGEGVSVEAIGRLLNAGTNCGSCRPEIAQIIERQGSAA